MRILRMAGVLGVVYAVIGGCGNEEGAPQVLPEAPVAVRTVVVESNSIPLEATAIGTTAPYARAVPATRLMGRLQAVHVDIGDPVVRGQVLARVESPDLEARRQQAEAALRSARAAQDNAEKKQQRLRALHEDGAATQEELDGAETGFRLARAAVAAAREGVVEVEGLLRYAEVVAPFDGVVVGKEAETGDIARPGMPLLAIERLDSLKVELSVAEGDLAFLPAGGNILVEVGALGRSLQARVEARVPAADPASRTFRVRAVLANPGADIGSGMFVRARFAKGERPAVRLPAAALVERGQLSGAFVVQEERARLRWLRVGPLADGFYEVLGGLEPGERVVVEPPAGLRDGTLLEVKGDG